MSEFIRPRTAAAATFVGAVMTSVGLGLAVPHVRVTGWSVASVIGVIVLVGGLALFGLGVVEGLRSMRRRWWALAIPVGLVATYAVVRPTAIAVAATSVPRAPLEAVDLSALGGDAAVDDVSFAAADGVRLDAWWVPPTNGAAVVLQPGASSTRAAVVDQAAVLVRHGYGVLLVDPRGMGTSDGEAMNLGWYGERDVTAAIDWLVDEAGIEPVHIGALGESMGGEQVLGALAVDDRLQAVVAEGATGRVADDTAWLPDAFGIRGSFQHAVDHLTTALTDVLTGAPRPGTLHDAIASAERPVLLIVAGEVDDEQRAAEYLRGAAPEWVEQWIVPGAAHTDGLDVRPAAWEERVVDFFDAALVDANDAA